MANNQIIISRIQNRRGLKENLPQPLLPGEIALTVDTGELWVGSDPNQPPYGVRTYSAGGGDISAAEAIADAQIVSAKFTTDLSTADFEALVEYLIDAGALATESAPAVVLVEDDIFWDGRAAVFIAADIAVDAANTINNILEAIELEPSTPGTLFDSANSGALGTLNAPFVAIDISNSPTLTFATGPDTITRSVDSFIIDGFFVGQKIVVSGTGSNDGTYTIAAGGLAASVLTLDETLAAEGPIAATASMLRGRTDPALTDAFDVVDGDFQFGSLSVTSNATQGSNAANLINELNGAGLVTTFGNLQITTSGIGVGSPTFRDMTITDTDSGFAWSATGTASADSTTDELTFVSGTNINIDVDTTLDAIRISNTAEADPDKIITGFTQTPLGTDVQTEYTLAANTAAFTDLTGFIFDMDADSDIIFAEYSLNIGGGVANSTNYTVIGRQRILGNANVGTGTATLVDDQAEVRDAGLTGDVEFEATFVPGSPNQIQIRFINTFTNAVTLKIAFRRWMSLGPDIVPSSEIMVVSQLSGGDGGGTHPIFTFATVIGTWSTAAVIDDGVLAGVGSRTGVAHSASPDRWCAVGSAAGPIMTSDDNGTTWIERTADTLTAFNQVRWDTQNSQFIALGSGINTSPDGITWTDRTVNGTTFSMQDVCYDGSVWLAVAAFGTTAIKTSADGITWGTTLATPESFLNACMAISTRIFVGGTAGLIRYSDNSGASFTAATGTALSGNIQEMAHDGAGTIVAVGAQADIARSTDNGVSQTIVVTGMDAGNADFFGVIYDTELSLFVATGRNAGFDIFIASSPDGLTWTERASNGVTGDATGEGIASVNQINPFAG